MGIGIGIDRLADPAFFAQGRLKAHSDHRWFASAAEAASGRSSFEVSLDGVWKFAYAKNPALAVDGFQDPDYDVSQWDDIPVPAHIQLQGYDLSTSTSITPGTATSRSTPAGSPRTTTRWPPTCAASPCPDPRPTASGSCSGPTATSSAPGARHDPRAHRGRPHRPQARGRQRRAGGPARVARGRAGSSATHLPVRCASSPSAALLLLVQRRVKKRSRGRRA